MGWRPDDEQHRLGSKFAYTIKQGDVILIARRSKFEPETVGLGRVVGRARSRLQGLKAPEKFGSLRQLDPFIPMSKPLVFLQEELFAAVNQVASLHQLHPESNPEHQKLCRWMDRRLKSTHSAGSAMSPPQHVTRVNLRLLSSNGKRSYNYSRHASIGRAMKREDALVRRYASTLKQGMLRFSVGRLACDIYDVDRKNLIEAKGSLRREHIRMAVGQLLDYEFLAQNEISGCHKAILLPSQPKDSVLRWLATLKIGVVWQHGGVFRDNASGQFI
jgi:hypothetical protein